MAMKKKKENGVSGRKQKIKEFFGKTTFKTNRTFIGLAVETMVEFTHLKNSGEKHIVFTDCANIPDTKAVPGTQRIYQVMGENNVRDDGGFNLQTAQLQCSCKEYRQDPTNIDSCIYRNKRRELATHVLKGENQGNQPEEDAFGILAMTVAELKVELHERGLQVSGSKEESRQRLMLFLGDVGDKTIDTNEDDGVIDSAVRS